MCIYIHIHTYIRYVCMRVNVCAKSPCNACTCMHAWHQMIVIVHVCKNNMHAPACMRLEPFRL